MSLWVITESDPWLCLNVADWWVIRVKWYPTGTRRCTAEHCKSLISPISGFMLCLTGVY